MSEVESKPLNWTPDPQVGYTVERRADGGMQYTFTDLSEQTLNHWRKFALEHLLGSDRLTRNLYDLRQIEMISEEAMAYALEVSSDPSTRNIRLAVVVSTAEVRDEVLKIAALANPGGLEIGVFDSLDEAEEWLNRSLTLLI
jgi:hypothetical protein